MKIDNAAANSPVVWSSETSPRRGERVEFTSEKPANADKFVLNLPAAEAVYTRQEFVADERMGEGCAFCYTYMERTLLFENGGGITLMPGRSEGGYFAINTDKDDRTFANSWVDMDGISRAVEESLELIYRSAERTSASGSLSGNGFAAGFAAQSTVYKYSSAKVTSGTVSYKNGAAGNYLGSALSSREIYNKCAVFLAGAFGEKGDGLLLDGDKFGELFGGKIPPEKSLEKRENQLDRLKEFMEKNLNSVRKKDPKCGSLKTFADTYSSLKSRGYSEIASLVRKYTINN